MGGARLAGVTPAGNMPHTLPLLMGDTVAAMQAFDTYDRLSQIEAPTFIIHGDKDILVPVENAEVLRRRIESSQVRIVPGVAHMFFWEKPEESAEATVEFLASVPAPA